MTENAVGQNVVPEGYREGTRARCPILQPGQVPGQVRQTGVGEKTGPLHLSHRGSTFRPQPTGS